MAWTIERFLFSGLRRLSRFYPLKNEAFKQARVDRGVYQCAICKSQFERDKLVADHKDPVIDPAIGFVDWNTYIKRLFCQAEGFQILCKDCHDKKTKQENVIRRLRIKKKKK